MFISILTVLVKNICDIQQEMQSKICNKPCKSFLLQWETWWLTKFANTFFYILIHLICFSLSPRSWFCTHFKSQLATGRRLHLYPSMQWDNTLLLSSSAAPWGKGWYWFWAIWASSLLWFGSSPACVIQRFLGLCAAWKAVGNCT